MQDFTEQLKQFGAIILAGQDNNAEAATAFMTRINQLLVENPAIVKTLADPSTEKKVRKVLPMIKTFL